MQQPPTLTHEESIEIIKSMINTAKGNFKASAFYFMLWGWISVLACLSHFYLDAFTNYPHPYIVWLIGIPGWIVTMIYSSKKSKSARVKTYSDDLITWTWIGFGFSVLIIIFAGASINFQITPLVILLSGLCTFITGLIIRYKPLIIGGSSFWLFAPLAFYLPTLYTPLVMAVAIVCGYLIPAYMLKNNKD